VKQSAHFVELLLQRRISHGPTLPRLWQPHNSLPAGPTDGCRYAGPVGIFGRNSARQRLRRATRESLTIPSFSSAIDCTPSVIGGLWPAELSAVTAETATLADLLKADLEGIASRANDELRTIRRAGINGAAREATEARVIDEARARAVRRVELTVHRLHGRTHATPPGPRRPRVAEGLRGSDLDATQVLPVVGDVEPGQVEPESAEAPPASVDEGLRGADLDATQVLPIVSDVQPEQVEPEDAATTESGRHRAAPAVGEDAEAAAPDPQPQPDVGAHEPAVEAESDGQRLQRLLEFVAHQEPRLNWAVGDQEDGTTVLATDLAHGWIPPGITLPEGVRLLEPGQRTGKASAWVANTRRFVSYAPGDSLGWSADSSATQASSQPRELPAVDDLGWELSAATHWRDGLPRLVHTVAKAAAAGTGVVEEEIDLLRVHLDTARYRLLVEYPHVDAALLLNCLLLAATEGIVSGDTISANYHLAWFQKLNEDGQFVAPSTN